VLSEILSEKPPSNQRHYPDILTKIERDLFVNTDRKVLKKILHGLFKNAVENTPDEGRIEITAAECGPEIRIDFRDYGIGISTENQKSIFGGFFHTLETNSYSSKHPYEFNAGGAGLDLLRLKAFSKIFGFSVHFESKRCEYLPTDADICNGKVSACPHIKGKVDCFSSGGSLFTVKFKKGVPHGK
jgi:signal transduction histidine kinase